MMYRAMDDLKHLSKDARKDRIQKLQKDAQVEWEMVETGREMKARAKVRVNTSAWELRCIKCDQLGCSDGDIRHVLDSHHFVIDQTFHDRIVTEPHPDPAKYGDFQKTDKVYCGKCKYDWGIMAVYKGTRFPVIKVSSFIVINTNTSRRQTFKKWKTIPFAVEQLTSAELQQYAEYISTLPTE